MNELELYVDSLDPSLSNEEKVRLVKEWKKANKWGEQEVEVETKEKVKKPAVAEKDTTVTAETIEVSEPLDSGDGELVSQEINPSEFQVGMTDEQLDATRNYQKQYESVAKTNEVYSPEGDEYEYKFSVNEEGGLDYLTRKKGEEDFIKASDVAEFSIANTFGHLNEDQKKEFEAYQEQLKKIQEEPGTVTLIETDPKKKNLAVRAEDSGFYVPQKELPKASTEDAMKNFEKRTGRKPSSFMELTDEDYIIQDPTLLETSVTESLIKQNKQKVLQIREVLKGIKAGSYRSLAGIIRGSTTFINEQLFTAIADDKTLKLYNSLDVDKRQKVLNKMVGMAMPVDNSNIVNYMQDVSANFKQKSDAINETIVQYDQTIGDLFGEGFKEADSRKVWDATVRMSAEALKSLPSLVQAMIPYVGLGSIVVSESSLSSLEKQEEGEELSGKLNLNSLIHGVAEAGSDYVLRGIGKRVFKAIPKDAALKSIKQIVGQIAKDFGAEGSSESITLLVNKLADKYILGDEKAFLDFWSELIDTFLIGGALGGKLSAGGAVNTVIRQNSQARQVNRAVKDANVSTVASFYIAPKATENSIKLSQNPVAKMALDKAVQAQVDSGDISVEKGDEIKNNFIQTEGAVNTLNKLNVGEANQPAMVDLMIEQKALKQKIKEADNPSLTKEESARLSEIDTELSDLITKDKSQKIDIGAKKIAEEIGVGFESFDTQDDVDSAIATLQEEGGEIDAKNSDNYGTFVVLPDGRRIIILNKETATEDSSFTEGQHETAHAITYETVKNKPEAAIALGKALLNEIRTNKDINIKPGFQARLDQYIQDADVSEADTMEEVMTLVSDGLTDGTIEINETIGVKLGNFIRRALSSMGMKVKFKNGKDVLNFIKDYNRSVHRQQGLSRGLKKTAIEGAEVSITPETVAETEVKESVAKESKRKLTPEQDKQAQGKVKEIQELQKESEALAEKYNKPFIKGAKQQRLENELFGSDVKATIDSFVEDRTKALYDPIAASNKENLTRQQFIESMKSDIKAMVVGEFEAKQPLEKFITSRGYLRANSLAKRLGIASVEEGITKSIDDTTKQIIGEETTETAVEADDLAKKPTETTSFNKNLLTNDFLDTIKVEEAEAINKINKDLAEGKITEDKAETLKRKVSKNVIENKITETIIEGYKGRDVTGFKDLGSPKFPIPKSVAEFYADMFGIKTVDGLTKKAQNFYPRDRDGLRNLQKFLIENSLSDYNRLPKTISDIGKATGIKQTKLGKIMYNDNGAKVGTAKQYIDIMRGKNITLTVQNGNQKGQPIEFNKPVKDISRGDLQQNLKTAWDFHVKNRALETLIPEQGKRIQAGAKFSKRITDQALSDTQAAQEVVAIEKIANELGVNPEDVLVNINDNISKYKQLRNKLGLKSGGAKNISSVENALELSTTYKEFIKNSIPKGKTFSQLPKSAQQAIIDTVGFGDTRSTIGGRPLTYKEMTGGKKGYENLLKTVFGEDVLIGTGSNIPLVESVFAPRNWGSFRRKVEEIVLRDGITPGQAKIEVEKLLTAQGSNIDDTIKANRELLNAGYSSLINIIKNNKNKKTLGSVADLLESQVNRATGVFKGMVPMTSFNMKPEKGDTKNQNKLMHNEHLLELFNANKEFLTLANDFVDGKINESQFRQKTRKLVDQLQQAVISERMRVQKDASGASVRDFIDPLTFLGKDAVNQIPIGTFKLSSGKDFTGLNMAEFIAENLSNSQIQKLGKISRGKLSAEGLLVKNILDNYKAYAELKKANNNIQPNSIKSSKRATNQEIISDLGTLDNALNQARRPDAPVKKIRVFDFDDTLARSKSMVIVNMPVTDVDLLDIAARRKFKKQLENLPSREQTFNNLTEEQQALVLKEVPGATKKINATEFAAQAADLEAQGATFDFTEFSKVVEGKKGPLFSVAQKIAEARGTEDIFILTARPQDAAGPIQEFMKANGIDIPLANITGLGDGTAAAKGRWIASKAAEGYNDFYFADDAIKNVQAVKDVLSQIDVKSKVQQAKASKRIVFDKVFNDIIEAKTGIESYKQFSAAKAKTVGSSKGKFTFFTTPSAEDFLGLLYKTLGKGKVGDAQMAFYKTNLIDPFNRAEMAISQAKVAAGRDYKALKKQFKGVPKTLEKETGISKYTYQHAIRTYIWDAQGLEVPGLSKRDQKRLTDFIKADPELQAFADQLISLQKGKPYPKPDKDWTAGTITTDVIGGINKVNRKEYLQEWQENVDIIFSEKNINKLEAAFGAKYVEALKDSLRAMKSGSNRPLGGDRVSNQILDWLNNSVGAIMFLNTRSAVLQTISAVNFINWGDNNILKAGKAFANQKQFWGDFLTLMNSDYLLERRDGLKINVSESEIADAVEGSKNKVNAAISFLLNKGFVFTRYADSFAIASGGATFYRNRTEALVKQGMDRKAAEEQAFNDFRAIAEENQQSSSPMRISQQQRSLIGRIILQFGNTQLQYVRIQKRAVQDLVNKRGDWKSNISKIVYYGAIQNLLFNALQSGLAWALFDDDEDDEELTEKNKEQKFERTINGAIDSQLKGLGIQGAVIAGVKNALMTIAEQADKKSPKFEEALDDLLSIAPALGSKIRKLKSATRTVSWNRKEIKEKGFSMDNPAYLAGAQTISAVFNIPLDRAVMKMNNMRNILNPATENWQKVALALGWSGWDVGLPYFGLAEDKPVLTETEKQTQKLFDLNKSDQVKMLLDLGLTKKQIRALTKEDQRVKEIIKLQNKKK